MARLPRLVFAATLVGLGVWGLVSHGFTPLWAPVPKHVPAREVLLWASALAALGSGAGLLWPRAAPWAARLLLASLLLWLALFRLPVIAEHPAVEVAWENLGETLVVVAAAWTLYAASATAWDRRRLAFAVGDKGGRMARIAFGVALIPLGLAHLVYAKETAAMVPAWLPAHLAWVWFTGLAYIAAGLAVLARVLARPAAMLVALQMAGFTLLVWAPMILHGGPIASTWGESVDSWTLTIAAWVVAASYRGIPWLALARGLRA